MTVEWGDPPTPREPGYMIDWEQVLIELRSQPGEWAKVAELSSAKRAHDLARNIKDGRYPRVPPASIEVAARTIHSNRGGLWMRWVGAND